jgi:hypothetical protein
MHSYSEVLRLECNDGWWSHRWRQLSSFRTTKLESRRQNMTDEMPGWFWRTAEGQALLRSGNFQVGADPLDDPQIGDQREED